MLADLNLEITETAAGLRCRLQYNTALFTERFARAMLDHFEVLLGRRDRRAGHRVVAAAGDGRRGTSDTDHAAAAATAAEGRRHGRGVVRAAGRVTLPTRSRSCIASGVSPTAS